MSGARGFAREAQAALIAERAGLQTARGVRRDLATLRDPAPVSVAGPPAIDADILGGHAMAQLLGVLHDAGIVSDRTGFGQDAIPGQADSGQAPSSDDHTLIDGMVQVYRDEINGWIPGLIALGQLNPAMLIAAIEALAGNGLITRTGAGSAASRTLTAGTGIMVTNGNGVSGNPTAALDLSSQPIVVIQQRHAASDTVSTTSTVTWSTAITLDTTLPAGTWTCLPMFDVRIAHSAGGNADIRVTVNGSAFATVTQAYNSSVPTAGFQSTLATGIVSDGSTPITVTGDFKANAAGTVTPTGPRLVLLWQRTA